MRAFVASLALCTTLGLWPGVVPAQPVDTPKPGPRDLCPVCGMVVSKYPEWIATVVFDDGHVHHFDGAKDMFKFIHQLDRYAPGHRRENVRTIGVTEYYDLQRIDARTAWYVIGSEVLGPMAHDFIPFLSKEDAEEFMADHGGRRILRFDEINVDWAVKLDRGAFD